MVLPTPPLNLSPEACTALAGAAGYQIWMLGWASKVLIAWFIYKIVQTVFNRGKK